MSHRRQRIRDPLHGLIEFRGDHFEHVLWRAIQTLPFQRLRRVKQLGFSELVYPGATHTRFAHSLGTFNVGRRLMAIIREHRPNDINEAKVHQVLAATLLHDVGHGPFSHAFESVVKRLKLKPAGHEQWSDRLIRETEISAVLKEMGSGFANDVAGIIQRERPDDMYEAVVSSQFDADRLDYMQRDRLMTGTQHGAIDFNWLLANIEMGEVVHGVDDGEAGNAVETFVLGAKAVSAAETYVLGLIQLYQTVYFHKTTRGVEKLFAELLLRLFDVVRSGDAARSGLPNNHPLVIFAGRPDSIDAYLMLDDTVVWGALPMLTSATDPVIAELAGRLHDRKLYKCLDIRQMIEEQLPTASTNPPSAYCQDPSVPCPNWRPNDEVVRRVQACCTDAYERLETWLQENPTQSHRLLLDRVTREPYKKLDEIKGPLNQIRIRSASNGNLVDIDSRSDVVRAIRPVSVWRAYVPRDEQFLRDLVENVVREVIDGERSQ